MKIRYQSPEKKMKMPPTKSILFRDCEWTSKLRRMNKIKIEQGLALSTAPNTTVRTGRERLERFTDIFPIKGMSNRSMPSSYVWLASIPARYKSIVSDTLT